jgi:mannose-6-phosphate isomerase-like protein (cupin superfamily)
VTDLEPAVVTIRKREPEHLHRMDGLDLKLLLPWDGVAAPFRGAWCVLRPGDVALEHAHEDREIFFVMSGRAEVRGGGKRYEIAAGDLVFLPPGLAHQVVNETDEDVSYYAIWWDTSMSEEFLARQATPAEAG